jgi:hypothetical protein
LFGCAGVYFIIIIIIIISGYVAIAAVQAGLLYGELLLYELKQIKARACLEDVVTARGHACSAKWAQQHSCECMLVCSSVAFPPTSQLLQLRRTGVIQCSRGALKQAVGWDEILSVSCWQLVIMVIVRRLR